ncbi:alanine racemase [Labrys okinawensis]|uniref:alanine racemase n=1 Tax=Labrys okinawensis TaxID=346911 RepID=UPI0039BC7F49
MGQLSIAAQDGIKAAALGKPGRLTIDLSAMRRNYSKVSAIVRPAHATAVVKANAYGLGAIPVSRALYEEGCRHFFVAQYEEADDLRPALPGDAQIFILNGLQPGNERACAQNGIIPVLNSLDQLKLWADAARRSRHVLKAVLQFDTGMSRLGFPQNEQVLLAETLQDYWNVEILFVMSHLASADESESEQNGLQLEELNRITRKFPNLPICFANSGGVFLGEDYHASLVRPGIAVYGGAPTAGTPNPMEPVVTLEVAVVQTRSVPAGTRVGYGGVHMTTSTRRLATLGAGYADGLPRSLSDRGAVYYGDLRLPIVGRVSMDSMTIDVTEVPEGALRLGSLVEVVGPHQTLEDVAEAANTISYEILTRLGDRYHREYR